MNFDDEVGEKFERIVNKFTPKGSSVSKLNFGVEFQSFDYVVYSAERKAMTPKQRDAEDEQDTLELWDAMDPYYSGREPKSDHATMRIYHISGEVPAGLVEGDAWQVEVVKCYLNPDEPRTRDNRRKIHYSVKPIRRVEVLKQHVDFGKRLFFTQYFCGKNYRVEEVVVDVRHVRYRVESSGEVVDIKAAFAGDVAKGFGRLPTIRSADKFMQDEQAVLGRHVETKRLQRIYRDLLVAPDALLEHLERMGYGRRKAQPLMLF